MKVWQVKDTVGNSMECYGETKADARRWYKNTGIRGAIKSIEYVREEDVVPKTRNMRKLDLVKDPTAKRILRAQDIGNNIAQASTGRRVKPNERCKCGSGRKAKHCCGIKRA